MDRAKTLLNIAPEMRGLAEDMLNEAEKVRNRLRSGRYRRGESTESLAQAFATLESAVAGMICGQFAEEEAEVARLTELYEGLPPKQGKIAKKFIRQAARMKVKLDILNADIQRNGMTEKFSQSEKQEPYDRERPQTAIYTKMDKNYHAILMALSQLLPPENVEAKPEKDDLEEFRDG